MEHPKGLAAVAPQDGPAGGAQVPAPKADGVVVARGEWRLFGCGGPSADPVGHLGPELLAQVGELGQDDEPPVGGGAERAVEGCQLGAELVASGVELDAAPLQDGLLEAAQGSASVLGQRAGGWHREPRGSIGRERRRRGREVGVVSEVARRSGDPPILPRPPDSLRPGRRIDVESMPRR